MIFLSYIDQSNSGTFTIVTKLGVGAYASVYSACNENKEKLALKVRMKESLEYLYRSLLYCCMLLGFQRCFSC